MRPYHLQLRKLIFFLFALANLCATTSCQDQQDKNNAAPLEVHHLDYLPKMVGPGVISTGAFEGHASITPDGTELYFAIYNNDHSYSTIAYARKTGESWAEPKIAPFSGQYRDGSPALSPDGNTLFFSSNRPVSGTTINASNDLWIVKRENNSWQKPIHLPQINSEKNDFSPSIDREGNLYFCSNRSGGYGDMDVYVSKFENGTYRPPALLKENINSKYHEGNVGVSPDGNLLFVMVQHKPGDFGYDDIHYSKKVNGDWTPLKNVGDIINTYTYDFSPKVSPDGKTLYFSSRINRDYISKETPYDYATYQKHLKSPLNGLGNIYQIEIDALKLD